MQREDVANEIARLSALPGYPSAIQARLELVNAALAHCRDKRHLRETIDEIVREWTRCPAPAEIRVVAMAITDDDTSANPGDDDCPACFGTGLEPVTVEHRDLAGEVVKVQAVRRCTACRRR